jgi:DNA/RNA-binding domain of Phe-tRNA-synthetase-like protein
MEVNNDRNGSIRIKEEISDLFPDIVVGYLYADIINSPGNQELWGLLIQRSEEISRSLDEESIRRIEGISAGKKAYRHLGKDPNRYRLSAESLMRRAVKGKEIYSISTAVDALNLVSLRTGITIGGFDARKIKGKVELGIGLPGEEFFAIGRGPLNVEKLPVYRDEQGAIGNPTSDSERTQINLSTNKILMLITGFFGLNGICEVLEQLKSLLTDYCQCSECNTGIITYS